MPSTQSPFNQEDFSRPLSGHYDNLSDPNLSRPKSAFDIKFRFDEQPARMHNTQPNTNAQHHQGCSEQPAQPALPHQYENVFEAVHMRNLLRDHKSTINDARSEFFGLNTTKTPNTVNNNYSLRLQDDARLIHESEKPTKIMSKNNYDNFESEFNDLNLSEKKISPTSSSSNSSSTTITPSSSPVRSGRKSSNGSKSPKFKLPESPVNSPSQAVYLSTTVPQNIKGSNIMGRHKPTRNSLRHSRMIVVNNKTFQDSITSNSLNIRYLLLAKIVLVWKMIIGVCLTTLGVWLLLWAPSTRTRDNPYWSGAILIASGFLGLFLLSFKRKRSTKLKGSFFMFVKINESVIIILSVFLTTLAFIYATIHYFNLSSDNKLCLPENVFEASSSCICRFNVNGLTNKNLSIGQVNENGSLTSTTPHPEIIGLTEIPKNLGLEFHYRDLSCTEVVGAWVYILLGSLVLNFIGLILSVIFLTQFVFGCKKKEKYLSVRQSA